MCGPAEIFGAMFSAMGKMQEAEAQQKQANAAARIADNNARVAEWQAQSAETKGQADVENVGRKQSDMRGKQMAGMAANGVSLADGSPAAILEQTDYYGLADQRNAAQNSSDEAWALRARGTNSQNEASMQRSKASGMSPFGAGVGSLLGSVGDVADKWATKNPSSSKSSGVLGSWSPWSFAGAN
jgi:hypothetical protein